MSMRHKCRVMRPPFSFPRKKTGVARPKERRFPLQASSSKSCNACRLHCPVRGVAIRFDLLLSSAVAQPLAALPPYGCGTPLAGAALPILYKYSLISAYCQSPQCGERSNAAFGTQSAAEVASHAPHDSKARLQSVTDSRDSWRSHVHRTRFRRLRSSSSYRLPMCGVEGGSPRLSPGVPKGVFSLEREYPL